MADLGVKKSCFVSLGLFPKVPQNSIDRLLVLGFELILQKIEMA